MLAICQSAVPALAAVALMEEDGEANVPASLILAGAPIDTRVSPTVVNKFAERRGNEWFRNNVITNVPWPNAGAGRGYTPVSLTLRLHVNESLTVMFSRTRTSSYTSVHGDGDSAEKHRAFYNEYLAVMDLTAEFYLQTIDTVFISEAVPKGEMVHRRRAVISAKSAVFP